MPDTPARTRLPVPASICCTVTRGWNEVGCAAGRNGKKLGQPTATSAAALFAGVGGIELGLSRVGFKTEFFCEALPEARRVLSQRFPGVPVRKDIRKLVASKSYKLPDVELISAGFPCQDLSQCGLAAGIRGKQSGLVACLF